MINNNKQHINYAAKVNNKFAFKIEDLPNSGIEDLSFEESSNVIGGRFQTIDGTLLKTDVKSQPVLVENFVFQPNKNDRLHRCAIDPTFC